MKTEDAIRWYGGVRRLASALGVWPQVIYKWGDRPPMARQYEIQVRTKGELRADDDPKPDA
ncbi:MAG TPA: Cro/CI family transcriptional regulator [Acidimicrobiia bacterium]